MPKIPFRALIPSHTPMILCWISVGILIVGSILGAAYGMSEPARFLALFSVMLGIMTLPLIAVLLEIAAWVEKEPIPRFLLGVLTLLVVLVGGIVGSLAIRLDEADFNPALSFVLCTLPVLFLFAIPGILAAIKLPNALRQAEQDEIRRKTEVLLAFQDDVIPFEKISAETGLPVEKVGRLLKEMIKNRRILGEVEVDQHLYFTSGLVERKQTQLLGMIQARGTLRLADISGELDIPAELVRTWLYELIQKGLFKGSINWKEEMVYSQEAAKLPQDQTCPKCGGGLTLAGKGVLTCSFCDTEYFLPGS